MTRFTRIFGSNLEVDILFLYWIWAKSVIMRVSVAILGFRRKNVRDKCSVCIIYSTPNMGHSYPDVCGIVYSASKPLWHLC